MSGKGSGRRPGEGYAEGLDRISPRCSWCRGRKKVTQKAADPAQPPVDVDCPKCKKEYKDDD